MAITLNDLTVNVAHLNQSTLLEDWEWLLGASRLPILVTALGDAFLQDEETGEITLLSAGPGEFQQICEDVDSFRSLLADQEFVTEYFVPGVVIQLRDAGVVLGEGQLYGFKTPPALGGEYVIENHEPTDIAVHFSILGQINGQVAAQPAGTPVGNVEVN